MPPPVPPSVKLGRMTHGRPMIFSAARASSIVCATSLFGLSMPILVIALRNFWRSSALSMTSALAPISSQPYFSSTPMASSFSAVFSAVWPPMVGSRASGRSLAMIFSTISGVMGSI